MRLLTRLFLVALAAYRVTRALVSERGPFAVLEKLRMTAGVYSYDATGQPESETGKALACPYCTGFWAALVMGLLSAIRHPVAEAVLVALAAWGGQTLLEDSYPSFVATPAPQKES